MKKLPHALLPIILAGLAFNAHALCVNQDGTLDDASVPASSVVVDVLPACEDPSTKQVSAQASESNLAAQRNSESISPVTKAKPSDMSALAKGDCQTAEGESLKGSLGAAEMLPECGSKQF